MSKTSSRAALGIVLALLAAGADAHPGHGDSGLVAGLMHPFLGLDHLAAMVAVGLWSAAVLPAGRRWFGPGVFVSMLLLGAVSAWGGTAPPGGLEIAIAASVVVLAAMLLARGRLAYPIGLTAIAVAGLLHGFAHGSEWASGISFAPSFANYAAGFVLGSIALHAAGWLAAGRLLRARPWVWPATSALIGGSGLLMLAARL